MLYLKCWKNFPHFLGQCPLWSQTWFLQREGSFSLANHQTGVTYHLQMLVPYFERCGQPGEIALVLCGIVWARKLQFERECHGLFSFMIEDFSCASWVGMEEPLNFITHCFLISFAVATSPRISSSNENSSSWEMRQQICYSLTFYCLRCSRLQIILWQL